MTSRPTRIDKLIRLHRLREDAATGAWHVATHAHAQAEQAHAQAEQTLEAIGAWKGREHAERGLNLDHYQAALALESQAQAQVQEHAQTLQVRGERVQETHDHLLASSAAVKTSERRGARQAQVAETAAEKKSFETLRDAWLGRPRNEHE